MEWFKSLQKGADLHTHFSSLIDFDMIIEEIQYQGYEKDLFYNPEKNELFFDFNRQSLHPCYFKEKDKIQQQIQKNFYNKTYRITNPTQKSFVQYNIVGNLMYCIIKSYKFYKKYIDLIFRMMHRNNYFLIESRLKLDFNPQSNIASAQDILQYIQKKNTNKYPFCLKIILQFHRDSYNLIQEIKTCILYLQKNFQKFPDCIIGVDFTGHEKNPINQRAMEVIYKFQDGVLLQLMKTNSLQFYNHGGEYIAQNTQDCIFQDNVHFQNVSYLLQHQYKFRELYQKPIRIGHGLIYLQYLMKENLEIQNTCFEICPFSNEHFYQGQLDRNIYEKYADYIVIGTDDQQKMNRNLSECYLFLSNQIKTEKIKIIIQNSIKYSSLDTEHQILDTIEKENEQKFANIPSQDTIQQLLKELDLKKGFWDINQDKFQELIKDDIDNQFQQTTKKVKI